MKFSNQWLKKYLETDATPDDVATKLVELGLEVESVDDPSASLKGFVYARVVEREKHPNADRLSLCKVDAGTGQLIQVVCGAPNVKANMGVAFASVGTVIPITGEALKKGTIRDVESCGMLCSSKELLLGEDSDGIMDLGLDYKPGTPLTDILTCDAVYDVSITPNRGDCFGIYGIARDLSAAGFGILKSLDLPTIARQGETPAVSLATSLCFQFGLCRIGGVKNAASPAWLQDLLTSAGQKPISALVDITNYFCLGLGRPMHVFDADKVQGHLVVREAKDGEMLKALNGQEYHLKDGMVVVADDRGVEAIGGIMGGSETAVDENTTNILLEAAIFDPISIATTGQRLNLVSDSRMRLERGVDTAVVKSFLDMATAMIVEHCGGTPATALLIGNQLKTHAAITLDHKQAEQRLGLAIEPNETVNILQRLGCTVEQGPTLKVTPPSWRHDLTIPEDLIEEIARLKGYSEIIAQSLPLKPVQNIISREEIARKHLSNRGFLETINWSFTDNRTAKQFTDVPENLVLLANPISEDLSTMRPSALALLLKVAKTNTSNARPNGSIFEVGSVYGENFPNKQAMCITGLRFGDIHDRHWLSPIRSADVFDAKADTLSILKTLGISESSAQLSDDAPSYYHPGRKGLFKQGNRVLAYFGELHPQITEGLNCVGFEIFLDSMHAVKTKKIQATLTDLMPVRRDFAFVLDASIPAQKLVKAVEKAHDLIVQVDVFDYYQGQHVEQGKKSLAVSVMLQPTQKTLDEESLTQIHESIVHAAVKIGAQLR
ncbi:MAG: phenylalanine--tRNA ligase subunit beta [Alphaproteobacteria bacterium]